MIPQSGLIINELFCHKKKYCDYMYSEDLNLIMNEIDNIVKIVELVFVGIASLITILSGILGIILAGSACLIVNFIITLEFIQH